MKTQTDKADANVDPIEEASPSPETASSVEPSRMSGRREPTGVFLRKFIDEAKSRIAAKEEGAAGAALAPGPSGPVAVPAPPERSLREAIESLTTTIQTLSESVTLLARRVGQMNEHAVAATDAKTDPSRPGDENVSPTRG